mmetsp:Transcript_5460/g.4155  ORF Transcript_5460/g.4155 Transcript_5460/m.4155 type:complete len:80 (-) Transcript_5460:88-327(-)
MYLRKARNVYLTLNKFKKDKQLFYGFFWVPSKQTGSLMGEFRQNRMLSGATLFEKKQFTIAPPTHFELNEFTTSFHEIV